MYVWLLICVCVCVCVQAEDCSGMQKEVVNLHCAPPVCPPVCPECKCVCPVCPDCVCASESEKHQDEWDRFGNASSLLTAIGSIALLKYVWYVVVCWDDFVRDVRENVKKLRDRINIWFMCICVRGIEREKEEEREVWV